MIDFIESFSNVYHSDKKILTHATGFEHFAEEHIGGALAVLVGQEACLRFMKEDVVGENGVESIANQFVHQDTDRAADREGSLLVEVKGGAAPFVDEDSYTFEKFSSEPSFLSEYCIQGMKNNRREMVDPGVILVN